jgi:PAT family beta-lactamase induction signal transducer AmpG
MNSLILVFLNWRMAVVLLMGFSCGIPLGLTGGTLQAWMATEKLDITLIGIFSLVGLPYTLKFLWSPFMDRFVPPFLGRRRGWMIMAQIALVGGIAAMAFHDPATNLTLMAFLAVLVAFFSASQDIAVDAFRIELMKTEELGAAASVYIMGYRIAMLVSGGLALILADHMSWKQVYLIMAATMAVGIVTTLLTKEPQVKATPPRTIQEAVVFPFVEFFKRNGILAGLEILLFVIIYKLDVALAMALTTPFMLELGFSKTDVGAVLKSFGLVATIVGALVGGSLMTKMGIKKALWIFGIIQGISGASFMFLAHVGHNYAAMVTAVTIENICSGLGTAAFAAFMMSICNKKYTATQYALITSVMALTRTLVGAPSGYLQKAVGWEMYFLVSILIAIPGLLLLLRYDRWMSWTQDEEQTVA